LQIRALGHALCRRRLRFLGGGDTAASTGCSVRCPQRIGCWNRKQNSAEDSGRYRGFIAGSLELEG
jgi:uncharacterized Fe-S cluster-containing radical SAM superfamily protein